MGAVTKLKNFVLPPATFITLLLFLLPPLYLYNSFQSFLSSLFAEVDMTNKVVLITGASSGIGEQIAYQYAMKGAFLVLVARRGESLIKVAEKAMDLGAPDVLVAPADIAKVEECRRIIGAAINCFGRLDHLVNNAGVLGICMFDEVAEITDFHQVMNVNFWGSVFTTHFALPHLKKTRGRIIVNSSSSGWAAPPRMSFYNATNAALITFYETLQSELGPEIGISISIPVGGIESEMTKGKFLSKEGEVQVDQEMRDSQFWPFPLWDGEDCAKTIVDAACRRERYVTDLPWLGVTHLFSVFAPEVSDWSFRLMFVPWSHNYGMEKFEERRM